MKRPRLVPNAKRVAKHSWSFWLNGVGAVLGAVELGMSVFASSPPIPVPAFAALYAGVNLLGMGARLVAQSSVSGDK
ncbi:hypothetical protein OKC48_07520 [Methylorubrum extorquens]|uniref:DUF7940 domain-containing protein n=1 Tax=Methylorubrum extorquens TaxID=408 RepID=UPI002238EFC1|nr:hypothetical protein [Methylorubrum extorquens]UYW28355.1 hypothetical protein OKC48_07520 [Methylorubrum extorquens]